MTVRVLRNFSEMTRQTLFKMFDAPIQPIVLYGSEIWGLQRGDVIEKVHTFACKRFLNVPLKTPNKCVLRTPCLSIRVYELLKYWFKLLHMNENRLPKQAYHMQINMELNGKCCWACGLRDLLCKFGFGFVWLQKIVGTERAFFFFWQFSRNDSVMISTKSGLPLLT